MNIAVFGMWHLGSVTAACLADKGFSVMGLDPDGKVVDGLKGSKAPLFEPGLDELITRGITAGRLRFTTDPALALRDADHLWVTFDTPVDDDDNADVPYVRDQILSVLKHLKPGAGVIVSSQVPVGFARLLEEHASKEYPTKSLAFAVSPENLRLGKAISVFQDPDRIVVGVRSERDRERFLPLFSAISDRLEWMGTESAEMVKHAINTFLATSVTLANELASVCEEVGADASEMARGLKSESRIGPKAYVNPGAAFAGGTLARDVAFLVGLGGKIDKPLHLLRAVQESNNHHKGWAKLQCKRQLGGISGKSFTLLGLTYKPDTDTLRRSLAVELATWLSENGGTVTGFDPRVKELPAELGSRMKLAPDVATAVRKADCVLVATEWPEFRKLDNGVIAEMGKKVVIDPNGFLRERFKGLGGAKYITVGRNVHETQR